MPDAAPLIAPVMLPPDAAPADVPEPDKPGVRYGTTPGAGLRPDDIVVPIAAVPPPEPVVASLPLLPVAPIEPVTVLRADGVPAAPYVDDAGAYVAQP